MCCVESIVYAYSDFTYLSCSAKLGTFGTLDLLIRQDVDVIFGPVCSAGII